jgi:hypothetical protein
MNNIQPKNSKMKNQVFTFFLLLLFTTWWSGETKAQSVFVKEKDGQQSPFEMNTIRNLIFADSKLVINQTSGVPTIFNLVDIRYLNFNNLDTSNSISERKQEREILIYPNPAHDFLTIQYRPLIEQMVQIEILTLEGKIVYQQKFIPHDGLINQKIQITDWPKGLYLCRLINGNIFTTKKIIVNQ